MTDPNISHAAWQVGNAAEALAGQIAGYHATWHSVLKPKLFKDGTAWCALHGEDLQVGIAGFGDTPAAALLSFEIAMCSNSGSHVTAGKGRGAMTITMRCALSELLVETNKALDTAKAEGADQSTRLLLKLTAHNLAMILDGQQ